MNKFTEIVSGWKNLLFKTPEIEKVAKQRAKICSDCELNNGGSCSSCGCLLSAKTRSMSDTNKCPIGKW